MRALGKVPTTNLYKKAALSSLHNILLSLGKPKVKLYRDKEGNLKGDARCCYLKVGRPEGPSNFK
jgi:hypothetical protein